MSTGAAHQAIEVACKGKLSQSRTILDLSWTCFSRLIPPRDAGKRTSAAQRGSQPRPGEQPQLLAFVAAEAKEKALPPFVGRSTTPLDNGQRLNTRTRSTEPRTASTKKALHSAKVSPTPRQPSSDALRPLRHGAPALRATTKTASAGPRLARRVRTVRGESLEGGRQPRALHAATR